MRTPGAEYRPPKGRSGHQGRALLLLFVCGRPDRGSCPRVLPDSGNVHSPLSRNCDRTSSRIDGEDSSSCSRSHWRDAASAEIRLPHRAHLLDPDLETARPETVQPGNQPAHGEAREQADRDPGVAVLVPQPARGLRQAVEGVAHGRRTGPPGAGQAQTGRVAMEQDRTRLRLETPDLVADRPRRTMEPGRGPLEARQLHRGLERPECGHRRQVTIHGTPMNLAHPMGELYRSSAAGTGRSIARVHVGGRPR